MPPCNESSCEETVQRLGHYLTRHKVSQDTCMPLNSCTDSGVHNRSYRLIALYQKSMDVRGSHSKRFNASSSAVGTIMAHKRLRRGTADRVGALHCLRSQ